MVKLVMEQKEATIRSTPGRRSSKRKVVVPQPQDLPYQPIAGFSTIRRKTPSDAKLSCFSCAYSLSHRCAFDARCLDQALLASTDHLADISQF